MIGSLASFFTLVLYSGNFPGRVAWTLWMYTMGTVALARLAIEQSRAYAMGYAIALGAASLFVMARFFGSPIFSAFMLLLIGYLSDRIVHDCTIVNESRDSSGRGLLDGRRRFLRTASSDREADGGDASGGANSASTSRRSESPDENPRKRRRREPEQPGRTVLYLALAALPLFGLGQFMIPERAGARSTSLMLLAVYLFSSLSLLVTTSFLGLRRYLRQRQTDMPANVSIAWLTGGLLLIAVILAAAFLLPMPGRAIASVQVPNWIRETDSFSPSRFGWGDEGTDETTDEAAKTGGSSKESAAGGRGGEAVAGPGDSAAASGKGSDGGRSSGEGTGPSGAADQDAGRRAAGQKDSGQKNAAEQRSGPAGSGEQSGGGARLRSAGLGRSRCGPAASGHP